MLTTSHSSSRPIFTMDWLSAALLSWGFLRTGLRNSVEVLPDHLRRDVGLPPRIDGPTDPRDWRW